MRSLPAAALFMLACTALAVVAPPAAAAAPAGPAASAGAAASAPSPAAAGAVDWEKQTDALLAAMKPRLGLSDAQTSQIRPILAAHLPKMRALFDSYAGAGIEAGPSLIGEFRQTRAAFKGNLDPILNDAQRREFLAVRDEVDHEIRKAVVEARLGWYRRTLGIDDAQAEKARPIVAENFDRRLALLAAAADSQGAPAATQTLWPEVEKVQAATDARLAGVFTPQQMETYRAAMNRKPAGG